MSAVILAFPSGTVIQPSAPQKRTKSLIVRRERRRFAVVMHPILSDRERLVRETFRSADVARAYASHIVSSYPEFYRSVDDQTGGAA